MKKHIKTLSFILCLLLFAILFVGCSDVGAPEKSDVEPAYAVDRAALETELAEFMENNPDRTTYTENEQRAALYLINRLHAMGYAHDDVVEQEFSARENNSRGKQITGLKSRNVIAYYRTPVRTESVKNVVIGAYYDNRYSAPYEGATALKSEGALSNGTGVATLLAVAEHLITQRPELETDVTVVFFGASYAAAVGSDAFYKEGMTAEERKNTVLMIELQRLGCDHVYAFSDARETKREAFFDAVASENGLNIYKPTQKSPLMTAVRSLDGIPYYQWAHNGLFSPFFNAGIPTLNLVGANWENIDISDRESANSPDISFGKSDTVTTLKKYYPDYSERMAEAATLVIRSLHDPRFLGVMQYDRAHFPQTDILTTDWLWELIVLVVMGAIAAVCMFLSPHFAKKYAPAAPPPKRMKMAVFGVEYEDKDSADIFVDVRRASEEIFPGISNNDVPPQDPFSDIFPPVFGGMSVGAPRNGSVAADIPPAPDLQPEQVEQPEQTQQVEQEGQTEQAEQPEQVEKTQQVEQPEQTQQVERAEQSEQTQQVEQPEQKATAKRRTAAKPSASPRRSVSAGKSRGAGKKQGDKTENKDGRPED